MTNGNCERCGHDEIAHGSGICCGNDGDCMCTGPEDLDVPIGFVTVPEVHGVPLTDQVIDALRIVEAIEARIHPQRITLADWRAAVARVGAEA